MTMRKLVPYEQPFQAAIQFRTLNKEYPAGVSKSTSMVNYIERF